MQRLRSVFGFVAVLLQFAALGCSATGSENEPQRNVGGSKAAGGSGASSGNNAGGGGRDANSSGSGGSDPQNTAGVAGHETTHGAGAGAGAGAGGSGGVFVEIFPPPLPVIEPKDEKGLRP